ncbi:MAG: RidA family protein [Gemmatimonadota bacterium]
MRKVHTEAAPAAIGPYSQAMVAGDLVYTAGQIALDPENMEVVGTEVGTQTEQVMRNLRAVLEAAGSSLQHVIKTTVFLADMGDFAPMNEVYARFFGDHAPARSTVAVRTLPKEALVEIEVVALRG